MQVTEQKTVVLDTKSAPVVSLDDKFYKLVDKMDSLTLASPSLKEAKSLTVKGPVKFEKGVVIRGDVLVVNGELHTSFHPEAARNVPGPLQFKWQSTAITAFLDGNCRSIYKDRVCPQTEDVDEREFASYIVTDASLPVLLHLFTPYITEANMRGCREDAAQ